MKADILITVRDIFLLVLHTYFAHFLIVLCFVHFFIISVNLSYLCSEHINSVHHILGPIDYYSSQHTQTSMLFVTSKTTFIHINT